MPKAESIEFDTNVPKKRHYFDLGSTIKNILERIVDPNFMNIGRWRKFLNESQWWSYEQLKDFQLERLKDLSSMFNLGINSWEDFYKLPLMTKEDIRKWNEEGGTSSGLLNKVICHKTSGSTGEPLTIYGNWYLQGLKDAVFERAWIWCGWDRKKPILRLTAGKPEWWWYDWMRNVKPLNYRNITQEHLDYIYNKKPWIIHGVAGAIREITTQMIKQGQKDLLKEINVYLMSEDVKEHTKELSKYYKGVYAGYGLAELTTVASQCFCQNYHVNMETAIVESIDGEIVVTDLWNDITPIIRYRTGDKGKIKSYSRGNQFCSCGIQHDILYDIDGRKIDYYDGPEVKRPIGWWCVSPISHDYGDLIKKWKVEIYPKKKIFKLFVVWKKGKVPPSLYKYRAFLIDNLGFKLKNIETIEVDKISLEDKRHLIKVIL